MFRSLAALLVGTGAAAALLVRSRRRKRGSEDDNTQRGGTELLDGEVRVRDGTTLDIGAISGAIRDLAKFEDSLDQVHTTQAILERDSTLFRTVVAVRVDQEGVERELVGFAFFSYGYSTWVGKTLALDDLYVSEAYRSKGVGSRLLRAVAMRGRSDGVQRMEWLSFKWNEIANVFYESRGAERQDRLYYWRMTRETMGRL